MLWREQAEATRPNFRRRGHSIIVDGLLLWEGFDPATGSPTIAFNLP